MAKENFEDLLRELKGEAASDLGEKLKNVLRRIKTEMEKRVIEGPSIAGMIMGFMKEEGIYKGADVSVANSLYSFFYREFKPIVKEGMHQCTSYFFFENTPIPEKLKEDLRLKEEMETKVDEYVKEHDGKPDPKEFMDFVYSIHPKDVKESTVSWHYTDLRHKYKIEEFKEPNQLKKDIESQLKNLDLSDIK